MYVVFEDITGIIFHFNTVFPLIVAPGAKTNFWGGATIKNINRTNVSHYIWAK